MGTMGGRTVEGVEPELDDVADEDEFGDALLGTELGELIKELVRNGVALEDSRENEEIEHEGSTDGPPNR